MSGLAWSETSLRAIATAATVTLFAAGWCIASYAFGLPPEVIPQPHQFVAAVWQGWVLGTMWTHMGATLGAALAGFCIGCTLGAATALLISEFAVLRRALVPLLMGLQSIPLVAIAPLIVTAVGFGIASKILIAALFAFFPVLVNLVSALSSPRQDLLALYRACAASRLQILVNVRVPAAAGAAFAGMQIAFALSLIGAVVGEFVAASSGLGFLIKAKVGELDVATAFAATAALAVTGAAGIQFIRFMHRKVVFWERPDPADVTVQSAMPRST